MVRTSRVVKHVPIPTAVLLLSSITEPRSGAEIGTVTKLPSSTVYTTIQHFGPIGLIERRIRSKDWTKKSVEFLLTEKGRQALAHYQALEKLLGGS